MKEFKKLLVLPITAFLVLATASCGGTTTSNSGADVKDVKAEDFVEILKDNYFTKDTLTKTADFTLPVSLSKYVNDTEQVTASISYTLAKVSGLDNMLTLGDKEGNTQKFVVNYSEANTEESVYKVTANITYEETSASYDANWTVPEYKYATFAEFAKAAKDGSKDVLTVKGKITALYNYKEKIHPYIINDAGEGFYGYNPTYADETYTAKLGDEVILAGTATSYNGQLEFNGCTVTKKADAAADFKLTYKDASADFAAAASSKDTDKLNKYQNSPIELNDVTLGRVDSANNYYYFTIGNDKREYYFRPSKGINNLETVDTLVSDWKAGYTANLRGLCTVYSNTFYIQPLEITANVAVEITNKELSGSEKAKIAAETVAATIPTEYGYATSVTLPATSDDATLTYKIAETEVTAAKVDNGKLVITPQASDVTATLNITATLSDTDTGSASVKLTVLGSSSVTKLTAAEAYTETGKLAENAKSEKYYMVSGTLLDNPSDTYCNFNLDAGDGNKFYVYGLSDGADQGKTTFGSKKDGVMPNIHAGDTVTIYTKLYNYKGTTMETDGALLIESKCIHPTVYTETPAEGTVTLGTVAIALDATGMIIYASYTVGCGGPQDGFYCDGTIMHERCTTADAGKTIGIFELSPEWAPWPDENYTHYKVVVPEGGKIITGTSEQMVPVVNSIFGQEFTEITGNAFFETQIADGAYNDKVVEESNGVYTLVEKPETPVSKVTYTFSSYEAGTQYAENEVHVLDETLTCTTNKAHFTTEIRLYDNSSNDGTAVFASTKEILSITLNAGSKDGQLLVQTSTDGSTWTDAETLDVTSAYADYTVTFASPVKYFKLDSISSQQLRVKSIVVSYIAE